MKKKIVAMLMASAMAFSLCACGGGGNGDAAQTSGDENAAQSGENSAASAEEGGASGEVTKLIVAFPTWTGAPADTEKVQEAMNDITRDKLGIEIELQVSDPLTRA